MSKITVQICYLAQQSEKLSPIRKHSSGASGYDLHSTVDVTIGPKALSLIATGIAVAVPKGYEAQVRSRSGLATKGVFVLNSPGTIDSDYRGEIKVILCNFTQQDFVIQKGMRIAQLVFCPIADMELVTVETLTDSSRGEDGFGSTGL